MTERGKDIQILGLTISLLLFQLLVLERRGENAAAHLGRIGILAAGHRQYRPEMPAVRRRYIFDVHRRFYL